MPVGAQKRDEQNYHSDEENAQKLPSAQSRRPVGGRHGY
jgi:hypothetical protein